MMALPNVLVFGFFFAATVERKFEAKKG